MKESKIYLDVYFGIVKIANKVSLSIPKGEDINPHIDDFIVDIEEDLKNGNLSITVDPELFSCVRISYEIFLDC